MTNSTDFFWLAFIAEKWSSNHIEARTSKMSGQSRILAKQDITTLPVGFFKLPDPEDDESS